MLLEGREALWEWWLAWLCEDERRRRLGPLRGCHLEDAGGRIWPRTLPCMKLSWPVIMHGIPELWTTRERWNAGHKGRESIIGAKQDVLGHGLWSTGQGGLSTAARGVDLQGVVICSSSDGQGRAGLVFKALGGCHAD